ncbi:MAG: hypothetical protein RL634_81 [Bacteroidota bacterium]|jgi:hypothetical protein
MNYKTGLIAVLMILFVQQVVAQEDSLYKNWKHKKNIFTLGFYKQPGKDSMVDVWDGIERIFGLKKSTDEKHSSKPQLALIPSVEYSLITGIAASINSNILFPKKLNNASFIYFDAKQTFKKQTILEIVSNFWFANDQFNLNTDWSIMRFPQKDFGLGGNTSLNYFDQLNYSYLKLHQTLSRRIAKDLYLGAGLRFDYHWGIKDTTTVNKPLIGFREYGFSSSSSAGGFTYGLLYDKRRNAIHPVGGESYFQSVIRNNLKILGSSSAWSSFTVDARKYVAIPYKSNNVLAFWSYNILNLSGNPPYLVLPHTAVDPFKNTGRGYIQSRYRGKSLLMQEMEYRFSITENGFLGGVVYGNIQSVSDFKTNKFSSPIPGYGVGIRIKYNKKSNTNIALDYAWGKDGSRGFFMNLGEVF